MMQDLFVIGINHLRASVSCRERVAVPREELLETLRYLRHWAGLDELVIVSTCSRVEAICLGNVEAASLVREWFANRTGAEDAGALYERRGAQAVEHVFRVAAGLDSWILGEAEILAQVKQAYHFALDHALTGRVLNRVLQSALAAGKAVRGRTGLQNGIHSIGGAAALLARRIFGELRAGTVVVFGAGQAAEAVVRHLAAKNFKDVVVANRTLEKARAVAGPLGARAVSFEEGIGLLARAEVAVFAAAGPKALLTEETLRSLAAPRRRPLFLIDLGLPRNVEEGCARVPETYLYDLDDLQGIVQESMGRKASEKEKAEALAAEAARDCCVEFAKPAATAAAGGGRR
ncbi:MAG: glutamyl-tRNA reductase [Elusimicrobia bacterium]|nr:glutamyl-tRNA reductase [Elusimicrobiota bacterium]